MNNSRGGNQTSVLVSRTLRDTLQDLAATQRRSLAGQASHMLFRVLRNGVVLPRGLPRRQDRDAIKLVHLQIDNDVYLEIKQLAQAIERPMVIVVPFMLQLALEDGIK